MSDLPDTSPHIETLQSIMARLRDPIRGCPWNLEQDFATIAPYTIEEAYEVVDAIDRNDLNALKTNLATCCYKSFSIRIWPPNRVHSNLPT